MTMLEMKDFFGFKLLPGVASEHGASIDRMNELTHWLMLVLLIGWGTYMIVALWKFRAGKNKKADYKGATGPYSSYAEIGVILFEILLLVGFSIPFWLHWSTDGIKSKNAEGVVSIRVVAQQYQWNFQYPGPDGVFGPTDSKFYTDNSVGVNRQDPRGADDIVVSHVMMLPVGKRVSATITSRDVIHGFGQPHMRIKQDATPGYEIPISWVPSVQGEFEVACSQLCGGGHSFMRGIIKVVSEEEYKAWLQSQVVPAVQPAG